MRNTVVYTKCGERVEKRELSEYVPDYILEADYYNRIIKRINVMLEQTHNVGVLPELKLSFWVEPLLNRKDAFSLCDNGQYYIALSLPLLKAFKDIAEETFNDEFIKEFLSDMNKEVAEILALCKNLES